MAYGFEQLKPEYEQLFALMRVERPALFNSLAVQLVKTKDRFVNVSEKTEVPIALLMAFNERESSNNFNAYLGDGENIHHVTHMVPAGRGPFATWDAGAIDALAIEHMIGIAGWNWAMLAYYGERWNGFGYRAHGKHSAYLWSGTNIYTGGKFTSDGHFEAGAYDTQPGIIPLIRAIVTLDTTLEIPGWPSVQQPLPAPAQYDSSHGVAWVQSVLNRVDNAGLVVDNSAGRLTRAAISAFQKRRGIAVDGLAGPITEAALRKALVDASA